MSDHVPDTLKTGLVGEGESNAVERSEIEANITPMLMSFMMYAMQTASHYAEEHAGRTEVTPRDIKRAMMIEMFAHLISAMAWQRAWQSAARYCAMPKPEALPKSTQCLVRSLMLKSRALPTSQPRPRRRASVRFARIWTLSKGIGSRSSPTTGFGVLSRGTLTISDSTCHRSEATVLCMHACCVHGREIVESIYFNGAHAPRAAADPCALRRLPTVRSATLLQELTTLPADRKGRWCDATQLATSLFIM